MVSFEKIPPEVAQKIFSLLDKPTLFNASLTCRQWMGALSSRLPSLDHLHIELDSVACNGRISYRNEWDTSTSLCQCNEHVANQGIFLREVLQLFGNRLSSVAIEDCLLYKCKTESVDDCSIHIILKECGNNLKSLEFRLVDMAQVRVWTLVIIARFSALTSIHFDSCEFPSVLTESMFIRMLAPSFNSLETIYITDSKLISDKFSLSVAKQCSNLTEFNVSGSKVTALTVVSFCEALAQRANARPIALDLRNTLFDSMQLSRYLYNPLLKCGPCWIAQRLTINIGFDRAAIVLGNRNRNDLIITVYISE